MGRAIGHIANNSASLYCSKRLKRRFNTTRTVGRAKSTFTSALLCSIFSNTVLLRIKFHITYLCWDCTQPVWKLPKFMSKQISLGIKLMMQLQSRKNFDVVGNRIPDLQRARRKLGVIPTRPWKLLILLYSSARLLQQ